MELLTKAVFLLVSTCYLSILFFLKLNVLKNNTHFKTAVLVTSFCVFSHLLGDSLKMLFLPIAKQ